MVSHKYIISFYISLVYFGETMVLHVHVARLWQTPLCGLHAVMASYTFFQNIKSAAAHTLMNTVLN